MTSTIQKSNEISRRYAKALFDLASPADMLNTIRDDLDRLNRTVHDHDALSDALKNPIVPRAEKAAVLSDIARALNVSTLTRQFCDVLGERNRIAALPAITQEFTALVDAHEGRVTVQVTAAHPLTPAQEKSLQHTLAQRTKKDVSINLTLDPNIMGGLVIQVGSMLYDASLRAKLESLRFDLRTPQPVTA